MEIEAVIYVVIGIGAVSLFLGFIRESMGKDAPCGMGRLPLWPYYMPAGLIALSFILMGAYVVVKFLYVEFVA